MDAKTRREPSKIWGGAFFVVVALALIPYFSLASHEQSLIMDMVGLAAAGAMFVGIAVSRPEPPVAWIMIGLGSLTMTGGDIVYGSSQPVPSPADMFYVTAYALLALGLLSLARSGTRSPSESSLTDVMIVAIGVAIAGILFLVVPAEHGDGVGFGARAVSIGYPLIDLALIAILIRPILRDEGRRIVFLILGAGLVLRLLGTWRTPYRTSARPTRQVAARTRSGCCPMRASLPRRCTRPWGEAESGAPCGWARPSRTNPRLARMRCPPHTSRRCAFERS